MSFVPREDARRVTHMMITNREKPRVKGECLIFGGLEEEEHYYKEVCSNIFQVRLLAKIISTTAINLQWEKEEEEKNNTLLRSKPWV